MEHLIFLKSCSSKVATMNMFIKSETAYIPDLFLIFFYISIFFLDHVVDRIFIVSFILYNKEQLLIVLFVVFALLPVLPLLVQLAHKELRRNSKLCLYVLPVVLAVFGLDSFYLGVEALTGLTEVQKELNISKCNSFIHITEEKLFIFKSYCYLTILIKTIPQLIWMPIIIMESNLTEFEHLLALTSIMANVLILSLTIAVTFPVRKSKLVYKTCIPLLLNSFSKFMATTCACCIHLIIFTVVYRHVGFKVFLVLLPKFLIWLYPSYHNLHETNLSTLEVFLHGLCLALISTFIYIHPFNETGTFFYYSFNLFSFFIEMISINVFSEINRDLTTVYLTLRILAHGYVACFRITDNICTFAPVSAVEGKKTSSQDVEKATSQPLERKDEVNEIENGDENLEIRQPSTDTRQNEQDN